nr:MAG TPA_asm: hypothetical protein [Caudoviricetes sp.]
MRARPIIPLAPVMKTFAIVYETPFPMIFFGQAVCARG